MPPNSLPQTLLDRVLDTKLLGRLTDDFGDLRHVRLRDLREQVVHGLVVECANEEGREGGFMGVVLRSFDWGRARVGGVRSDARGWRGGRTLETHPVLLDVSGGGVYGGPFDTVDGVGCLRRKVAG